MPGPTIRDVAARAGTSTAVVSYVLNDGPRPVAAATRERVMAAVAELGYRRNNLGRALRANRTGTLGLVVPDLAKPFFAELARAIEDAAFAHGRRLLIGSTHFDADREHEQIQALLDARVDAMLVVPAHDPTPAVEVLRAAGIPYSLVHHTHPTAPGVAGRDFDAGRQATRHLIEHGHQHIAVLGAASGEGPVSHRSRGALATLAERRRPTTGPLVLHCPFSELRDDAYRATRTLLAEHPSVTALCATTDEHALGALRAATEAGRRVGDDLALVSIDGTELGAYLAPSLTTLAVPFAALGADAVDHVLKPSPAAHIRRHRLSLVLRRSCGCRP
ncbi:LacI family DNA-binding transcriptional regulator [Micromonospora sp. 4G55]|uniref:LacI family DNA-binding transcriptional regulator n=1 Tax=Micromonospora sp. 4G55 TaxID=2806102 RepID=UPI001A43A2D0|nr:LacI family DNA-binding transcriptional regulator [Micromonospora sp. 4G55]MBM0258765.1 LacI family DNA-binding transcriptional regulator [Micromonospora sp. 4G55]